MGNPIPIRATIEQASFEDPENTNYNSTTYTIDGIGMLLE
jgi:hypothetical protein